MREIKFRGKRLDDGEWVLGDYLYRAGGAHCIIDMQPDFQGKVEYVIIQVDAETVGQFTGLRDRNGKEIYEGDIVKQTWGSPHFVNGVLYDCFGRIGDIRYECDMIGVHTKDGMYQIVGCGLSNTVIGNIHDNPELLKSL